MNGKIMTGLKKKLDDAKSGWLEIVPEVLWSIRTTHHWATGEMPFSLTYGAEAIILAEIGVHTHYYSTFSTEQNEEQLRLDLDILEEKRYNAVINTAVRVQLISKLFNKRVHNRQF